jgi:hypothetical protein
MEVAGQLIGNFGTLGEQLAREAAHGFPYLPAARVAVQRHFRYSSNGAPGFVIRLT